MRCSGRRTSGRWTRRAAGQLAAWQATGRLYGRWAGEWWQLRLPLMTMVGLTLLGVYDCTAATPLMAAEPAPAVHQAAERPTAAARPSAAATAAAVDATRGFDPAKLGVCRAAAGARVNATPMAAAAPGAAMVRWTGFAPATQAPPRV